MRNYDVHGYSINSQTSDIKLAINLRDYEYRAKSLFAKVTIHEVKLIMHTGLCDDCKSNLVSAMFALLYRICPLLSALYLLAQ